MENSIFGQRIRKLRVNKGYSMEELAQIVGTTKSSVNMWENGGSIPRDNILIELSTEILIYYNTLTQFPFKVKNVIKETSEIKCCSYKKAEE